MSAGLPTHLQPTFDRLSDDLVDVQIRWQMYRQLFGTNERRVALLNSVAPSFFGTTQIVLWNDVLSGIARITGQRQDLWQGELGPRQLLDGLDDSQQRALIAQLEVKLAAVEKAVAPIRDVRHKRLAHRDYNTAVAPQMNPLPAVSRQTIETALAAISDFMKSFQLPFTDTTIAYADTITALGDGDSLVKSLRRVIEHRRLEREGKVPPVGELSAEYKGA